MYISAFKYLIFQPLRSPFPVFIPKLCVGGCSNLVCSIIAAGTDSILLPCEG